MVRSLGERLEQYTIKRPQEVLLVNAEVEGEEDQVMVFKGFSSSLMRPTAIDPDVPVLPNDAKVLLVDRLHGPYEPNNPTYIEQGIDPARLEKLLQEAGV
jgi:hypothetical protein